MKPLSVTTHFSQCFQKGRMNLPPIFKNFETPKNVTEKSAKFGAKCLHCNTEIKGSARITSNCHTYMRVSYLFVFICFTVVVLYVHSQNEYPPQWIMTVKTVGLIWIQTVCKLSIAGTGLIWEKTFLIVVRPIHNH